MPFLSYEDSLLIDLIKRISVYHNRNKNVKSDVKIRFLNLKAGGTDREGLMNMNV